MMYFPSGIARLSYAFSFSSALLLVSCPFAVYVFFLCYRSSLLPISRNIFFFFFSSSFFFFFFFFGRGGGGGIQAFCVVFDLKHKCLYFYQIN